VAIYRPSRPRWRAIAVAAVLGLVVGVGLGVALASRSPSDPAAAVAPARTALVQASNTLEVASVEYEESVSETEVVARTEYEGARDALARSRRSYHEARPALEAIAAPTAAELDEAYDALERQMGEPAPPEQVGAAIDELGAALRRATGG
jgi:hypothetical protein